MDFKIHLIKLGGRKEGERKKEGGEGKRVSDYLLTHTPALRLHQCFPAQYQSLSSSQLQEGGNDGGWVGGGEEVHTSHKVRNLGDACSDVSSDGGELLLITLEHTSHQHPIT